VNPKHVVCLGYTPIETNDKLIPDWPGAPTATTHSGMSLIFVLNYKKVNDGQCMIRNSKSKFVFK